jgi:hypothetical protein
LFSREIIRQFLDGFSVLFNAFSSRHIRISGICRRANDRIDADNLHRAFRTFRRLKEIVTFNRWKKRDMGFPKIYGRVSRRLCVMFFCVVSVTVLYAQMPSGEELFENGGKDSDVMGSASDSQVSTLKMFDNIGWNFLYNVGYNYGANFLSTVPLTYALVKSGGDWEWYKLVYGKRASCRNRYDRQCNRLRRSGAVSVYFLFIGSFGQRQKA